MKYVYPAIFTAEAEGGYSVSFPDVEGCYSQGKDLADAMYMAEDALALMLYTLEEEDKPLPVSTPIHEVSVTDDQFVSLVKADTLEYRKMFNSKAVKKTLTIPGWLNEQAEKANVNFSKTLQDALMSELHLQ